jgi:hypothetical protein
MIWSPVLLILLALLAETIAECEFSDTIRLTDVNDEYSVTLKYKSSNTTLTVELSANNNAYLGFGHSPTGLMRDATVVMGGGDDLDVAKYSLFNRGAGKLPSSQQTLANTNFEQSQESSVLTFTKLLKDVNEDEIDGFGDSLFIWALGLSNDIPSFHSHYGGVTLNLNPFCEFVDPIVQGIPFKSHFKTHGVMAALAWGILTPLAIAAAVFRQKLDFVILNNKGWILIHKSLNMITFLLTVGLVGIAIAAYQKKGLEHFKKTHDIVGLSIMIIMFIQILSAFLRPPPTQANTDFDSEVADHVPMPRNKATVRLWWERFHRTMGILLVALSMHQLYSGEYMYRTKYGGSDLRAFIWTWFGAIVILIAFAMYKHMVKEKE